MQKGKSYLKIRFLKPKIELKDIVLLAHKIPTTPLEAVPAGNLG